MDSSNFTTCCNKITMKASSNRVFLMREKFTWNIFLIVRLSYIRITVSRPWHPDLPSSPCPSLTLVLHVFPSLRHYLLETRKRSIRLTYVVARLLLQRSLQSQFWHSYSRVRPFMTMSVKYTTKDRRDQRKADRIWDTGKDGRTVLSPLRLPFESAFERRYIFVVYRHGRLRNIPFAVTRKISLALANVGFTTSPANFYVANDMAIALRDNGETLENA